MTESDGDSGTTTVQLFVPADGSATYTVGDLWIQETYWSGITGDETVDVTVMNIATIDGSGEPVEYETDGPTITVSAPNTN